MKREILSNSKNIFNRMYDHLDKKESTIFLSGSIFEGFGNKKSDIDVFIIYKSKMPKPSYIPTEKKVFHNDGDTNIFNFIYNDKRYDIEYWSYSDVIKAINQANSGMKDNVFYYNIPLKNYDFLHRMRYGESIVNKEIFTELKEKINIKKLMWLRSYKLSEHYSNLLEDIEGTFESQDFGSCSVMLSILLRISIQAFLSIHGETNPKEKWLYRMLLRFSEKHGRETLDKYKFFNKEISNMDSNSFEATMESILNYTQKLNSEVQDFLKNTK